MTAIVKRLVSQNKRRFQRDGFDLDLSYVTPRIIAMSFPSQGVEALFRNSIHEVMNFLTHFHDGHFKIFNLNMTWSGVPKETMILRSLVEMKIPFDDHNPAPLNAIMFFCQSASEWLSADSENVIAVHCKAGKGRTGLMICAFLLYSKECLNATSALLYYAEKRTQDGKGVTIPSQRRYVHYFEDVLVNGFRLQQELLLSKVCIRANTLTKSDVHFKISSNVRSVSHELETVMSTRDEAAVVSLLRRADCLTYELNVLWITGDVKVDVFHYKSRKEVQLFYFWFNTGYVGTNMFSLLSRNDLDKPSESISPEIQVHLKFVERRVGVASEPYR